MTRWTQVETDFLVRNYHDLSLDEIAHHINRGKKSILSRLVTLGINKGVKGRPPAEQYTGVKIGMLTFRERTEEKYYGGYKWLATCDCGKECRIQPQVAVSSFRNYGTISCGCGLSKLYDDNHTNALIVGQITNEKWNSVLNAAEVRNIPVHITPEFCWELFLKQGSRCALSNVPLYIHPRYAKENESKASLDRIDSSKPYTEDNVQWVSVIVNKMKNNIPEDELIKLCGMISRHKESQ
jgi:hypothetical protein